jgi:hypothetical protein
MATATLTEDPVLVRFRAALDEVYGVPGIERVVLFGSRARGDAGRIPTTTLPSSSTIPASFGMISAFWLRLPRSSSTTRAR